METYNKGLVQSNFEPRSDVDSENMLRVSDNSQIAQLDAGMLAAAAARECPVISTINIDKSSGVHIGPKIVSVVQNVDNNEKVKGRFLGLELVSLTKRRRRLRCSVAVFLCWACVVAIILSIFIAYLVLTATPQRLDIGINETWYLRRAQWQARDEYRRNGLQLPVRMVLIGQSAGTYCSKTYHCISIVLSIQERHLGIYDDIGPNFLVGGNGIVFEGRGANLIGVMVKGYNSKIISIMFLGNYDYDEPDVDQINHVSQLLDILVDHKVLTNDYEVLGQCQISQSKSPGKKLRARLKDFKHFNSSNILSCP